MSEGKVIILLNSCGVGERRQTFKAAWRLVFVISFLLFLIPGPEIYGLISASNFFFFFSNGDNLNTPHRQRELFLLSPVLSVHLFLTVLLCCSGFFYFFTAISQSGYDFFFLFMVVVEGWKYMTWLLCFFLYCISAFRSYCKKKKKNCPTQHYVYSAQMFWAERIVNKTCLRPRKWPTYTDVFSCCAFNPFHALASDLNNSVRTFGLFLFYQGKC